MSNKEAPRIVLIASRKGGAGRSTVALAAAQWMAQNHSTWIVDADLVGTELSDWIEPALPGQPRPRPWDLGLAELLQQTIGGHQVIAGFLRERLKHAANLRLPSFEASPGQASSTVRIIPTYADIEPGRRERMRDGIGFRAVMDSFNRIQVRGRLASLLAGLVSWAGAQAILVELTPFRPAITEVAEELMRAASLPTGRCPAGVGADDWATLRDARWRWLEVVSPDAVDLIPTLSRWMSRPPDPQYRACINRVPVDPPLAAYVKNRIQRETLVGIDPPAAEAVTDSVLRPSEGERKVRIHVDLVQSIARRPVGVPYTYLADLPSGPRTHPALLEQYFKESRFKEDLVSWLQVLNDYLLDRTGTPTSWDDFLA